MNSTTATYNPFVAAAAALTTDDAYTFYRRAAWGAAQRSVDDSIITVSYAVYSLVQFAKFAYGLGQAAGDIHFQAVADAQPTPKALPAAQSTAIAIAPKADLLAFDVIDAEIVDDTPAAPAPVFALAPAVTLSPAAINDAHVRYSQSSTFARVQEVVLAHADALNDAKAACTAIVKSNSRIKAARKSARKIKGKIFAAMTKKELIAECKRQSITHPRRINKADLIELLLNNRAALA